MNEQKKPSDELTLDPADWEAFRSLAHRAVDDMVSYLATVRERPVWQPFPERAERALSGPAPRAGAGDEAAYRDFVENVLPYPLGNIHPRFWGWVIGTGTPLGMLSEMLAAGMNPNVGGFDDAAARVERQVLDWSKELLGFPPGASGLLVSGGSMANLLGLTVARNARAGFDVKGEGLLAGPPLRVYASTECHSSVRKAVEMLGLGATALRAVPVDAAYAIDVAALRAAIAEDRALGLRPFCVVGGAGTVNTGAFDDLSALADLAEEEGLWFHVDGAFGALAALSPALRPLVRGMERADSLAFDFHKWMYLPYDVACVLVRDAAAHRRTFGYQASYLSSTSARGVTPVSHGFSEYGPELSRGFKALKVWMGLKSHGVDAFAAQIDQNVAQARHLAGLVEAAPELSLEAPVPLNIVCFRYVDAALDGPALDRLNEEIVVTLHESGVAVPSYTRLSGRYVIRVAITNHRSRRSDFDLLAREVVALGRRLVEASSHASRREPALP